MRCFILYIRNISRHDSLKEASAYYAKVRDASGEGASTFPEGIIERGTKRYRVSYNGKVWTQGKHKPTLVFDPYR